MLTLTGRVVDASDMRGLPAVPIRLIGPASALSTVAGAQPLPASQQITWTRQLSGFAGTRWECWTAHLQSRIQGITWEQFRDGALLHNPALEPDHLFKADQTYLLPQATPAPPYTWTRLLSGFTGSRWDCWTAHVQNQVQGITWEQFRDGALAYNPQLNADGRLFQPGKSYLIPQNDAAPRVCIEAVSDAQGGYLLTLGSTAGVFEVQIELDGYARFVLPLVVNTALVQPLVLTPLPDPPVSGGPTPKGGVRSARTDYASLPEKARRVIDFALFLLGDDPATFDALSPELRRMCYGFRFLTNPNDFHFKDIVCADLVSLALCGAGLEIDWGAKAYSLADYYHPDRGSPALLEITDPNDWLPGDILVYGNGAASSRAGHVNLYVGPFTGTDRSGKTYSLGDNVEVVEASMDFMSGGREIGTGVQGRTLRLYCLEKKCYTYQWVRRVRLRELAAAFGRG
ncbi:MAG TPA: hypothetical protein VFS21_34450 [Roseiflexaceae bacterium]|nr:hypothetical protein [Roseiflexaceae bacterium]